MIQYKAYLKLFFLAGCAIISMAVAGQQLHRAGIYKALASRSTAVIDAQLKKLGAGQKDGLAFEGALLMRKAGTVAVPAKKLSLFKQGHKKLESAIAADPQNAEYRFLRLMIQEHAPKNLGYNKNLSEDSKLVRSSYGRLPAVVQQSIRTYSKQSKALPSSALKTES